MRAYIQLQMYCSSWDGLLCSKRLSTGVGNNGKSFILDQDLETSCCVTSAKKKKELLGPHAFYSSCAEYCWVFFFGFSDTLPDWQTPEHLPAPLVSPRVCAAPAPLAHVGGRERQSSTSPSVLLQRTWCSARQKRAQLELLSSMPYFGL